MLAESNGPLTPLGHAASTIARTANPSPMVAAMMPTPSLRGFTFTRIVAMMTT